MRSFLSWSLLVAIFGAAAVIIAPLVARPLVADAVRAASPFGPAPLDVDVEVDPLELLTAKVQGIHVRGADLRAARVDVGRLDATASGVGLIARSFDSISGALDDVTLRRNDGSLLDAEHVELSGPSSAVVAKVSVSRAATLEIVGQALTGAGLASDGLELTAGGVRVTAFGQKTDVALGATDGSVAIAGSIVGGDSIVVFGPEPGDPWRITGVAVSPGGMHVEAMVDLGALLGAR